MHVNICTCADTTVADILSCILYAGKYVTQSVIHKNGLYTLSSINLALKSWIKGFVKICSFTSIDCDKIEITDITETFS